MRNNQGFRVSALCICIAACTTSLPPRSTVGTRIAAQNVLFEDQYQSDLKRPPERATAYGDYRYNDRLDDYSLAGARAQFQADSAFRARLAAISTDGFPEQDALSHSVMLRMLQQRIDNHALQEYEMPVSQMDGPCVHLADLPLAVPFDSVKEYEDYVARLQQIPRVFTETEEVLRAGLKVGLMPVRFLLEKVPAQCRGVVAADPFLLPLKKFPAIISAPDRERLTQAITRSVKFRELRERARQALGSEFDIRGFHDEMLNGGVLPLNLLDSRTDAWIRAQQRAHQQ
jgi:uncharacterized protein (DUF885 family)